MPAPGPSDKGFVFAVGPHLTCTTCWALVSIEDLDYHLKWHEQQENVPMLSPRYPQGPNADLGGT